ncbi:MAG: hypothetical protein PHY02_08660 [Phycisphaerae bacterium]|nr:hypothetical protein [Phycisphaerae bacterium]
MAKKRIFTVGFELPSSDFEYVRFDSDQTLLDADIILFEPTLGNYNSYKSYNGKPLLDEYSSFKTKERLDHWQSEIVAAVNAGKLVIVYLTKPVECYRYTGEKEFSGTGRSRSTTNIVTEMSSYESVPNLTSVTSKKGKEILLEKDATYLAPYWKEFSSPYEIEIGGDVKRVLLRTRTGNRIVGAAVHRTPGTLLFLPPLLYDTEKFVSFKKGEEIWTKEALKFGKKLAVTLSVLADSLRESTQATPPPNWTSDSKFRLAKESEIEAEIITLNTQFADLHSKKTSLETELRNTGSLRRLLYEQGYPLEAAILEALKLFDYDAKPFADCESEFDAVFVSPEGRCLGEAEGKDNKAINIDKLSQLERNLQEDFARDDVENFAKGVLFGNAFRLSPLAERGEFFTTKCISAAKRAKIALIRTPDMFIPAKYMKEHPTDMDYAKKCREAIAIAEGEVVVFPTPTLSETTTLSEREQGGKIDKH